MLCWPRQPWQVLKLRLLYIGEVCLQKRQSQQQMIRPYTCLGHFGWRDTDRRIISICVTWPRQARKAISCRDIADYFACKIRQCIWVIKAFLHKRRQCKHRIRIIVRGLVSFLPDLSSPGDEVGLDEDFRRKLVGPNDAAPLGDHVFNHFPDLNSSVLKKWVWTMDI